MKQTNAKLTKKQQRINESIRMANSTYKRASPAGRRVLIAKDALEQIKKKRYIVDTGSFVDIGELTADLHFGESCSLQGLLHDPTLPACEVCADGALFLSTVRLRNKFDVTGDSIYSQDVLEALTDFSETQRQLIEIAFEKGGGYYRPETGYDGDSDEFKVTEAHRKAEQWAWDNSLGQDELQADRLIAILKNIIRNKGTFNPYSK